ncbi:MAG: succinate dehydrogenase cytochrome b subunit [Candidatus Synoicihabitans palmerolidicus]|nr:succinate dehydrogenase cytochrome b subunit [Candidatus Synoicihabitans palmerolidicus]
MNLFRNLFTSSIGRKILMAVSGLVLVGFVTGHLLASLQVFLAPDHINGYAHFLQGLGPVLWLVRIVLLVCVGIHLWAAVVLTLENKSARGSQPYGVHHWLRASIASRYMRMSGCVVLAFILYHLAHFTIGVAGTETFKSNLPHWTMQHDFCEFGIPLVSQGDEVYDVYSMVFLGFASPLVSLFYIVAVGCLSLHLWHGTDSIFQTLGLRNESWSRGLRRVVAIYCLVYFLANLAIPGAILTGIAKPAPGTAAAAKLVAHR